MSLLSQQWVTVHDALNFEASPLHDMLALWQSKCRDDKLPGRNDFEVSELRSQLGWIVLIDVEHDPQRFRYRLIGSKITGLAGRDVTGQYFDQLYEADVASAATQSYRRIVQTRRPTRVLASLYHADRGHLTFEAIDLPLSSDGLTVDMIMVRSVFDIVGS